MLALAIAMPLLVVWTDAMAPARRHGRGQAGAGHVAPLLPANAAGRGAARNSGSACARAWCSACLIALVGCHFGLRIQPNTESLGQGTTTSVVTSITVVILVDAVFAVLFSGVGF